MRIYIDDDSCDKHLIALLRKAECDVALPEDARISGALDARHLECSTVKKRVLLTRNRRDFLALHNLIQATKGQHEGIMVVCFDNQAGKDMKARQTAIAVSNLFQAEITIRNGYFVLNEWR